MEDIELMAEREDLSLECKARTKIRSKAVRIEVVTAFMAVKAGNGIF